MDQPTRKQAGRGGPARSIRKERGGLSLPARAGNAEEFAAAVEAPGAFVVAQGQRLRFAQRLGHDALVGHAALQKVMRAAWARFSPSVRLYSAVPRSSQWPSINSTYSGWRVMYAESGRGTE